MNTAIITGANGGIGKAVTSLFREHDIEISSVSRSAAPPYQADISDFNQVRGVFMAHEKQHHTSPSVVVHCAAQQTPIGTLWSTEPSAWEAAIQTNTLGSYYVTRCAIRSALKYQKPCSIILFSGGGAAYARPYFSAYGVSKTSVLRLVETTAEELRLEKLDGLIQINAIAPGAVKTKMTEEIIQQGIQKTGERAYLEALQVAEGAGMPAERAAELCLFLSDRESNGGLSGRLIHVNEPYKDYANTALQIQDSERGLLRRVPMYES